MMSREKSEITSTGTVRTFFKKGTCSETLINILDHAFGHPLTIEEHASAPLAGGIAQEGYQCGMLWGAALAAGAQAYRLLGPGPQAEAGAIIAAQRLVESFSASNGSIDCLEITGADMRETMQLLKYLVKGGPVRCFHMAVRYAPKAFDEINAALAGKQIEAPSPPVSCSALLARKMGESELHSVMAAGLAGGIGLSGGGCGALGAAIWISEMNNKQEKAGYQEMNARAGEIIRSFSRNADSRFACSEIVGRKFEGIGDHADYLRDGGCSKIIEALAAK
jgi:hypothetical protein